MKLKISILLLSLIPVFALYAARDWSSYGGADVKIGSEGSVASRYVAVDAWAKSQKTPAMLYSSFKKNMTNPDLEWTQALAYNATYFGKKRMSAKPFDDGRVWGAWLSYMAYKAQYDETAKAAVANAMKSFMKDCEKPEARLMWLPEHWFWAKPDDEDGGKKKKKKTATVAASTKDASDHGYPAQSHFGPYVTALRGIAMSMPLLANIEKSQEEISQWNVEAEKAREKKRKLPKKKFQYETQVVEKGFELANNLFWRMGASDANFLKSQIEHDDGPYLVATYYMLSKIFPGENNYHYEAVRYFADEPLYNALKSKAARMEEYPAAIPLEVAAYFAKIDLENGDFGAFIASAYVFETMTNRPPQDVRAAAAWAELCARRWRLDQNVMYQDALEDAIVNRLMPGISTGKGFTYLSKFPGMKADFPVDNHDPRVQTAVLWAMAQMPEWIYGWREAKDKEPKFVFVNQYIPSTLKDDDFGIELKLTGDAYVAGKARIVLTIPNETKTFALRLRKPLWSGANAKLVINGTETLKFERDWSGYQHLPREWKNGDAIDIEFDPVERVLKRADGTEEHHKGANLMVGSSVNSLKPILKVSPKDKFATCFQGAVTEEDQQK